MATYSMDEYENTFGGTNSQQSTNTSNHINFFTLSNGEEAIVRFMYDSRSDFEIETLHNIPVGQNGNTRRVSCIAQNHDSNTCPLCRSQRTYKDRWNNDINVRALSTRCYVKLIKYSIQADNTVTYEPMIWDCPVPRVRELCGYIDNYGPLTDILCKVKREGTGFDTRYLISPNLSKQIYRDDIYVNDRNAFASFSARGSIIMERSYEDLQYYDINGSFPEHQQNLNTNTGDINRPTTAQQYNAMPQNNTFGTPMNAGSVMGSAPWEGNVNHSTNGMERPVRTYN